MSETPPNPHGYFPHESRPVKQGEVVPKPVDYAERVVERNLLLRNRRLVIAAVFVAALLCAWALDRLYFEYRFGPVFPSGADASTMVISTSWAPPQGVPKTYYRLIRETLGCYYPGRRRSATWWDEPPKTLKDTLEEYGAEVRSNKIYDASGREIRVIKNGSEQRRRQLLEKHYTVIVVDIAETADDE